MKMQWTDRTKIMRKQTERRLCGNRQNEDYAEMRIPSVAFISFKQFKQLLLNPKQQKRLAKSQNHEIMTDYESLRW